ncbi:alpha/beta hydrolase [Halobacillus sp. A1]|uniref:alpha/beta hydrolase n=1 Tax=Halobacillus sp. A1 TaxID=2880262 RepID=UPI0020A6C0A6|nr:alpha/beta hydrolase [Halobacillus sp. A1]MCP3030792.1 alpha/beta hydrolase [Halobacillus sp. A1]
MFTHIGAKLLRTLPNEEKKSSMVTTQSVKEIKEVLIETTVKPTLVTIYYPKTAGRRKLPVYINLHGGAFIMNSKEMDDPYCRHIANQAGCAVINIDYAKAPEYPFPNAVEQSYEILQWIKENADFLNVQAEQIALGGQSSGANIAAALCLLLKERREPQPLLQVLSCPMLDFVTPHADKPEPDPRRAKFPQAANFLNKCYVPQQDQATDPLASPVLAENTNGIANALFIVAEHDAFNPEAKEYAQKLIESGVEVIYEQFDGCYHAFTHLGPEHKAEQAWLLIEQELTKVFKYEEIL